MRPRTYFLEGLLELHTIGDRSVRRGVFRQSIASLGLAAGIDGPGPLDGIHPEALVKSVRIAISDGLLDDLGWLAASAAAVALYEIAGALPLGDERRDLGRRVLAQLYEGNATTFVAIAARMAAGSARGLAGAGVRARVALSLSLPGVADVPVDGLALALASRRELAREWIGAASIGSLPERRLAARLLERAAREAARRGHQGDDEALRPFRGVLAASGITTSAPPSAREHAPRSQGAGYRGGPINADTIAGAWRSLLADRETLVWRHVAVARGLLSGVAPEMRIELESLLAPDLTPTEWRRGATSLVAAIAVDPDRSVARAREVLSGPLLQRDPGIATAMVWGLARAVDAEPEAAEELLDAIAAASPISIAESLIELRREVGDFGAAATQAVAAALDASLSAAQTDDGLEALARGILRDVSGDGGDELMAAVRSAEDAFVEVGPREAHARAQQALAIAADTVSALLALDVGDGEGLQRSMSRRAAVGLLRDLDANLLESGVLTNLLLLGRKIGDDTSSATPLDDLEDRLMAWLVDRESGPSSPGAPHVTVHQRQLRALLHVIDAQTTQFGDDHERRAAARVRCTRTCNVLIRRLRDEGTPLRRAVAATLARALDALVRDGAADAADVLLHAAARVPDPDDLVVLAEASRDPDVSQLVRAYAAFARPRGGEPAATRLAALRGLVAEIPTEVSQRTEALRGALGRLTRGLEGALGARSLAALIPEAAAEGSPLAAIDDALGKLHQQAAGARQRCGDAGAEEPPPSRSPAHALMVGVERASRAGAGGRVDLERSIAALVASARANVTPAIADVVALALAGLPALPATAPAEPAPPPSEHPRAEAALPAWIPSRRTLGGFYVQRQLGGGAGGTVFVVTRAEERHEAGAERFALKVPDYDATAARSLSEAEFLKLFREEAGALLSLPEHENLARFVTFDAGARPKPILVMELVEGVRCDKILESRSLTMHGALALLDGVLCGLEAMHAVGVGHLDIKPSNVVLRGGRDAVLVDFGLSGRHLRPGCATGCYGGPEIWGIVPEGVTATPMTADVYSFGCLAYEVLTGKTLFDAASEVALVSAHLTHDGLPAPVKKLAEDPALERVAMLLHECLRHSPKDRAGVPALRKELGRMRGGLAAMRWPLGEPEEADAPLPLVRVRR